MFKAIASSVFIVLMVACVIGNPASADYVWSINATDTTGDTDASLVALGYNPPAGIGPQAWLSSTTAYAGSLVYTGDLGTQSFAKSSLRKKDFTSTDPRKWIFQVWCGADYADATFDVRIWASLRDKPSAGWRLFKLYDPISDTWGRTELTTSDIMSTSNGNITAPWLKCNLPAFRTDDPLQPKAGYILELFVPEPSAILTLVMGLGGLCAAYRRGR